MIKAYAYVRVSSRGQIDGDGFARQMAAIEQYSKDGGVEIAGVFEEKAVSGTVDGMDRPAWVQMMGLVMAGSVKTIIIERLDRLARDLMIQEHIIKDLQNRRVNLVSVAEPDLCSTDPTRELMRQIMGAIAQYDKRMIVSKLRSARDRRSAALGRRCDGAKPYGELPGEAPIRDRIVSMRKSGKSLQTITEDLNSSGMLPRRGARWFPMSVSRIAARA